ncbi:MAG: metallophosphoesterase [Nitrososphaeraceae archaeon]|nr:metallophosphoesterase [Nitrososphaeraceae archaeon]
MRIAQISDMHIGHHFKKEVFEILTEELNSVINPDCIIITGDLTDEGLLSQYETARHKIDKLNCSNKIILPGNHDYRHTGYLLFKKFFPIRTQIHEFNDIVILTLNTARPDRDEGEVGYRQNLWMEKSLFKFSDKIKVVAMHHHLISIPDTGTDKVIVYDAGDTLRSCLTSKVNLVLCGHKHRPWMWNLGPLEIAYAGTTTSDRYRGFFDNSYNIIEIDNNKTIKIEIKIVGGKRFPLNDLVENYKPFLEIT